MSKKLNKKAGIKKVMIKVNGEFMKVINKDDVFKSVDLWINDLPTNNNNNRNILFKTYELQIDEEVYKIQYYDEPISEKEYGLHEKLLNSFKGISIEIEGYTVDKEMVVDLIAQSENYGKTFFYKYYNKFYDALHEFLISRLIDMEMSSL